MSPRAWVRAPAVRAGALQLLALAPTLAVSFGLGAAGVPVSLWLAASIQGALAAAATRRCGLAPWWIPIQWLFPPALLAADALRLPAALYLLAFLLMLGLYWSTFRTQVPLYPSSPAVWRAVAQLLPPGPGLRLMDVGSGLGGLVLELARRRPDADIAGIELAPLPWLCCRLRARLGGSTARFLRGDYERLDFGAYDVVFAYLSPAAMAPLWAKAAAEMRPGALLLSYEFMIPVKPPDRTIFATPDGPPLYLWRF